MQFHEINRAKPKNTLYLRSESHQLLSELKLERARENESGITDSEERARAVVVLENDRRGSPKKLNDFSLMHHLLLALGLQLRRRGGGG